MQNLVHTEWPCCQSRGVGLDGLRGPFWLLVFFRSVKFPNLNGDLAVFLIPRSHSPTVTAVNLPVLFPITWQHYCGCSGQLHFQAMGGVSQTRLWCFSDMAAHDRETRWSKDPRTPFGVSVRAPCFQTDGYSVTSGKTEQQKAFLGEYLKPLVIWENLEMGVSLSSKHQQTVPSRMQSSTY